MMQDLDASFGGIDIFESCAVFSGIVDDRDVPQRRLGKPQLPRK